MNENKQISTITSVAQLVHNEEFIKKANDILGNKTQQFMTSVLSLANSNDKLKQCDPIKLYNACLMSASLDLPFNQNLGHAYIIPYGNDVQLQIGWKGFYQLAQRTGQFKHIHCSDVRKGEIVKQDRLTGKIEFDWKEDAEREKLEIVGFVAYIELLNGFNETLYMTNEELKQHATKYSQTFKKGYGVWKDNFDAMARKTVLKLLLSKSAPLSIDIQKAIEFDQADQDGNYVDNKVALDVQEAELGDNED